jgi:hypothetical protein
VHLRERTGPRAFNITQLKPALIPPYVHFERSTCAAREGTYVHWSEVLSPEDPRASLFDQAKKDEILDLIRRGTFDVVLEEEAISNADRPLNVLPCKFFLATKHCDNGKDVLKARFCDWRSPRSRERFPRTQCYHDSPQVHPSLTRARGIARPWSLDNRRKTRILVECCPVVP